MILEKKKFKQREVAKLLEIKEPEMSKLMNGRYALFSPERMFGLNDKPSGRRISSGTS
jgi:predicted XRE-type DNA-binding protein